MSGSRTGLLLLAALVALAACQNGEAGVFGSGTVEASDVLVSAEVAGRVTEVDAEEGRAVTADQVLVRIDDADLRLQRAQHEQRLIAAESGLSMLRAGAREEDLRQAQASVDQARESRDLARRTWERTERLFEAGSATPSDRDSAETALRRAEAALAAAEAAYQRLLAARPEEVRRAQAQVEEARIALALAQNRLDDAVVRSPRDGTVLTRFVEPGEYVGPGAPLVRIADLSTVDLTIYVPGPQLSRIALGQAAQVTVDGLPQRRFAGRVSHIADEAEFTPRNAQTEDERAQLVYAVRIRLANEEGVFKIGMPADARLSDDGPTGGEGR